MKIIKNSSFDVWGNDPVSANRLRFIGSNVSCCNCDCNWDGDGNSGMACTGSISN